MNHSTYLVYDKNLMSLASRIGQHDEQVPRGAGLYMSGFPARYNKKKIYYEYIRARKESMQILVTMQEFYVHFGHIKDTTSKYSHEIMSCHSLVQRKNFV